MSSANLQVPDLTVNDFALGNSEAPFDLRVLLYKGGAKSHKSRVRQRIDLNELGDPIVSRLPLVLDIYDRLMARIAAGGNKHCLINYMSAIRYIYSYADTIDRNLTHENLREIFNGWIKQLVSRRMRKEIKESTYYAMGIAVANAIAPILKHPNSKSLLYEGRIKKNKSRKKDGATQGDKQSLEHTFAFGHALVDIVDSLSVESIYGPLPIEIKFRSGMSYFERCMLVPVESLKGYPKIRKVTLEGREKRSKDTSLKVRSPAINLRIQSELLIFIAQTGMNITQASQLLIGDFRYESIQDGYSVRRFKSRRFGEVEFQIYSEYRVHFEKYLCWLKAIFPDKNDGLLFPMQSWGSRSLAQRVHFQKTIVALQSAKIKFIPPQALRNSRVNWLLRRSDDPDLTAEMAQHSKQVLLTSYAMPNHQRAVIEVTRFWSENDPVLVPAASPGDCAAGSPLKIQEAPKAAPSPDCSSPSGCLFCIQQRDIDSFDYVWSIRSLMHLKSLELAVMHNVIADTALSPAKLTIDRLLEKLDWYRSNTNERLQWVEEAEMRIKEGNYHVRWKGFILLSELL